MAVSSVQAAHKLGDDTPLVLDVDGTFLRTDLLHECFWAALGKDPLGTITTAARHFRDPAALKYHLARKAELRVDLLPIAQEVADLAQTAKEEGREVILASAADRELVEMIADTHELSERVIASGEDVNLKGAAKAEALTNALGRGRFDYAGNEDVDLAVWRASRRAYVVGQVRAATVELRRDGHDTEYLSGGWRKRALLKAMRPHQWVKNVLLLLPLIAAHAFGLADLLPVLIGIVAFSAAASSIYVVNDLLDLEADRLHATKKNRPFASGAVPIQIGMIACAALAVMALGLAAVLNSAFLGIVLLYMGLSLAYSLKLKRMRWIDIAALASLYTIRVVAGAAAGQVDVTGYMLVFVFPVFITLGCVKRLTELTLATSDARLPGRGYGRADRGDLLNVSALGMIGALLVFFLYSLTDHAQALYPTQWLLWVAMLPMAGWLFRMVSLGYRGKQDYDPIVFAMRDRYGLSLLILTLTVMFHAAGLFYDAFGF